MAQTGNKTQAARLVGVHPSTPYCPAWKADEAFQAGLTVAKECAAELLEGEAFKRATFGVRKPAGWYKGKPGGYVREYSDILAIFLLKGLRPERYQERIEVKGTLAHLDLNRLPDHLLQRIADGEHPLAVLASAVPVGADGTPDLSALPLLPSGGEPRAGEIVVEEESAVVVEDESAADGATGRESEHGAE
ncbi:MAG: hypothetical protein V3W34_15300 [Phycisphaerae bacterium]